MSRPVSPVGIRPDTASVGRSLVWIGVSLLGSVLSVALGLRDFVAAAFDAGLEATHLTPSTPEQTGS